MNLQAQISANKLQTKIGATMQVLIDEVNEDEAIGRTQGDTPEIDGNVFISNTHRLKPGDLVDAVIKDADEHDLFC